MNLKENIYIQGERIFLRSSNAEESEKYRILRNREENRRFFFTNVEISRKGQMEWYERYYQSDNEYMFSIYEKLSGRYIGALGIYHIDWQNKKTEIGRLIVDKSTVAGKGYGKEAVNCVIKWAVDKLAILTFYAYVYKSNLPSNRVFMACGFEQNNSVAICEFDRQDIVYYEKICLGGGAK